MYIIKSILIVSIFALFANATTQEIKTIAFAQDDLSNDFRKAQVFEVRDSAAKYPHLKFIYSNAKGQTSLMIRQIEKFIAQKVDLIIVGTNDEKAIVPVIDKAYKLGIGVIILDRGIKGSNYSSFLHSDNVMIGSIGAEYIAKRLNGKGRVLLLEGLQKADVTKLRSKGFMDIISQYPDIEVVKMVGNYLRKDTIVAMEKFIADGKEVDAIFSESDSMLSGVRSAQIHHGIDPASIITVGCDYTSEAQRAIGKGQQSASILFPLGGVQSVETALKIFAKEEVPKDILIPVQLVTDKNYKEIKPIF